MSGLGLNGNKKPQAGLQPNLGIVPRCAARATPCPLDLVSSDPGIPYPLENAPGLN
jgi:hypothetical protein